VESMRITHTDTGLHIEGFPDAVQVIQLNGPKARHLADLSLHRSDLQFALESLEALNIAGVSDHVQESLWRSAIVHFFKCFQNSASRSSLKTADVYKSTPPEAMMNFDHFKLIRNKHLVHDENSYAQSLIGAVLNDGRKTYKVEQILASNLFAATLDPAQYSIFRIQVQRARAWVDREFDVLCEQIKLDLEAKPYQDLLATPQLTATVPKLDELAHPRKRP
jgi:hypothetical protein